MKLQLRKELFWDVNMARLHVNKHARLIIERVFCYGTVEELREIFTYYGKEKIKKFIVNAGYLDKKTLNFASVYLRIPKEKFRCYEKRQSIPEHWN